MYNDDLTTEAAYNELVTQPEVEESNRRRWMTLEERIKEDQMLWGYSLEEAE